MSYLHIGGEIDLRTETIVCICDMDNATWSHLTRASLRLAEEEGRGHFHLDEGNSLEEGSAELIIEKTD